MKLAFIYGKVPSSWLTRLFTGSECYHVGFTDETHFWDMHLIRRRRLWKGLYTPEHFRLVECPVEVTAEYLDYKLDTDNATWLDRLLPVCITPDISSVRGLNPQRQRCNMLGDGRY